MAIIKGLGFEARDSQEAGEATRVVSKYIESTEGSGFAVRAELFPKDPRVFGAKSRRYLADVIVDGVKIDNLVKPFDDFRTQVWLCEGPIEFGDREGQGFLSKMMFAAVKIDESAGDYCYEGDSDKVKNLGLIELQIQRCTVTGEVYWPKKDPRAAVRGQSLVMAEQSLKDKAISHGMSIAPRQPVQVHNRICLLQKVGPPEAVFKFYYRTKKDLQRLLVIPPDPIPAPASAEFDRMPHAEVVRLAREEFDSLPIAEIMRLVAETFDSLSMVDIQDLARERFQQTKALENQGQ